MAVLAFLIKEYNNVFDIKGKFLCSIKDGQCKCNEYMVFDRCIHIELLNRMPLCIPQEEVHNVLDKCQELLPCSVDRLEINDDKVKTMWLKVKLPIRGIFDLFCEYLPHNIKVVS